MIDSNFQVVRHACKRAAVIQSNSFNEREILASMSDARFLLGHHPQTFHVVKYAILLVRRRFHIKSHFV